jgi:hypothetical protein
MNTQTLNLIQEELNNILETLTNELDYVNNPELINEITTRILNPLEGVTTMISMIGDDIDGGVYDMEEIFNEDEEWD